MSVPANSRCDWFSRRFRRRRHDWLGDSRVPPRPRLTAVAGCLLSPHRRQFAQHVLGGLRQLGALANQIVGAAAARVERRTRHGEDFPALLAGEARGDKRTGPHRRLDHDDAEREPGDNAVAAGEMTRLGLDAARQFAEHEAACPYGVIQCRVFARVDDVDATGEHRDGGCRPCRPLRLHGPPRRCPGPCRRRRSRPSAWPGRRRYAGRSCVRSSRRCARPRWRCRRVAAVRASPITLSAIGASSIAASGIGYADFAKEHMPAVLPFQGFLFQFRRIDSGKWRAAGGGRRARPVRARPRWLSPPSRIARATDGT